jgi:hypothetical protein
LGTTLYVSIDTSKATWNSSKDRELWRLVSKSSKTKDLDCKSHFQTETCYFGMLTRHRGSAVRILVANGSISDGRRAIDFAVPPAFLLQQAAWLYERHLDHVRAQMKKVGGQTAPASSSIDNSHAKGSTSAMDRRSISGPSGGNIEQPLCKRL